MAVEIFIALAIYVILSRPYSFIMIRLLINLIMRTFQLV